MNAFLIHMSLLFAQTGGSGVEDVLATYGPFAPFAALLLWLLKLLWTDNKEKEEEIRKLTEAAMERVIPLVLDASNTLSSAVAALNQLKDRDSDGHQLNALMEELLTAIAELQQVLRAVKRQQDGMIRDGRSEE